MVVCNNFSDYQILLSLRAHGWSREIKLSAKFKKKYKHYLKNWWIYSVRNRYFDTNKPTSSSRFLLAKISTFFTKSWLKKLSFLI